MWRDDEIVSHDNGTHVTYERYYIRTQCSVWVDNDIEKEKDYVPAKIILELKPYRDSTHLNCVESRVMFDPMNEAIFCENVKCPFFNKDTVMSITDILLK